MKAIKSTLIILVIAFSGFYLNAQSDENYEMAIFQPEIEILIGVEIDKSPDVPISAVINSRELTYEMHEPLTEEQTEIICAVGSTLLDDDSDKDEEVSFGDKGDDPEIEKEELLIRDGNDDIKIIYNDPNISLYPNPAIDIVNYELSSEETFQRIEIYDLIGNIVFQKALAGEEMLSFDLSSLYGGVYLVHFINSHKISAKKLAIRN